MWRWISVALIVVLVGGGVFSGITINNMTGQLNELELSYARLQSAYNSLQSDFTSLESDYRALESSYESLRSDYYNLQGRMSQLQSSYSQLQAENERLRQLLQQYEKVPDGYYSIRMFPYRPNTIEGLCEFLIYDFVEPRIYELDTFDCSESAACLEWALETAGFDASIAVGKCPWDQRAGRHAWVLVFIDEWQYAIEATALTRTDSYLAWLSGMVPGIVYDDNPASSNYHRGYDKLLDNIYLGIKHTGSTEEWNWWEGFWGFK